MIGRFVLYNESLEKIPEEKTLICTINAHSYNVALVDPHYYEALFKSDILIPDGISIVYAIRWLKGQRLKKIAGADIFFYELDRLQRTKGKCFFLGSSEDTLKKIKNRLAIEYPDISVGFFSPPFKNEFDSHDNSIMVEKVNNFAPDVLMVGMTAPKQEKWAFNNKNELIVGHICCIGAVFDFYAGTVKRAPNWMIRLGLEWLYRLIKEPSRMWKRYLIGNILFVGHLIREKIENPRQKKYHAGV